MNCFPILLESNNTKKAWESHDCSYYGLLGFENIRLTLTSSKTVHLQIFLIGVVRWNILHEFVLNNFSSGGLPGSIGFLVSVYGGLNLYIALVMHSTRNMTFLLLVLLPYMNTLLKTLHHGYNPLWTKHGNLSHQQSLTQVLNTQVLHIF